MEFTQTHVHRVSDAIQPSHPLSSPSPPPFNLSQTSGSFPMSPKECSVLHAPKNMHTRVQLQKQMELGYVAKCRIH